MNTLVAMCQDSDILSCTYLNIRIRSPIELRVRSSALIAKSLHQIQPFETKLDSITPFSVRDDKVIGIKGLDILETWSRRIFSSSKNWQFQDNRNRIRPSKIDNDQDIAHSRDLPIPKAESRNGPSHSLTFGHLTKLPGTISEANETKNC